jgi:hypothetical protein
MNAFSLPVLLLQLLLAAVVLVCTIEVRAKWRLVMQSGAAVRRPAGDGPAAAPAGGPDFHYCLHCPELIEASPDGWAVPWVHVRTRVAVCDKPATEFASWAEPAIPESWVHDIMTADLAADDDTAALTLVRCRHCRTAIEHNPAAAAGGNPWTHLLFGPACWLRGHERIPALFGKLAEPEDQDDAVRTELLPEIGAAL